jgi:predicted kinase
MGGVTTSSDLSTAIVGEWRNRSMRRPSTMLSHKPAHNGPLPIPGNRSEGSNAMRQQKTLLIMRGLPGSGKSTRAYDIARDLAPSHVAVLSTDDFFIGESGTYNFRPSEIPKAHAWNQSRADAEMARGTLVVIIDNTNTQAWQAKPYVEMAQRYGYEVEFIEPSTPWAFDTVQLAARNVHGCPLEGIERMLERYEPTLTVESCLAAKAPWER